MKNLYKPAVYLILLSCLAAFTAFAQQTEEQRVAMERQQREQEAFHRRLEERNRGGQTLPREVPPGSYAVRKNSDTTVYLPLHSAVRVPLTPEDKAKLTPAKEDFERYQEFLKNSNTGLAKIFPDPHCSSEFVLDLKNPKCAAALSLPGRGAFFSFRLERNFPFPYADIHFDDGSFKVGGETELGIISKLGDVEIESVELTTPGISAIRGFKPAKTEAEIRKQEAQIKNGFSADGFTYSSKAAVELNQTYVVRTVAFQHREQFYNDRRADILIVFRVIKQGSDGELTILWHRLSKNGTPRVTR